MCFLTCFAAALLGGCVAGGILCMFATIVIRRALPGIIAETVTGGIKVVGEELKKQFGGVADIFGNALDHSKSSGQIDGSRKEWEPFGWVEDNTPNYDDIFH